MCFYIQDNNDKPKVAENDIECFKLLRVSPNGNFMSSERNFEYFIGKTYSLEFGLIDKIRIGPLYNSVIVEEGFHSWFELDAENTYDGRLIPCKFVIPKGSKYYVNMQIREYVSNKIRFVGRMKNN